MTAEIAWLDANTHELLNDSCILFYGLTSVWNKLLTKQNKFSWFSDDIYMWILEKGKWA